jgi:hypothetical protein
VTTHPQPGLIAVLDDVERARTIERLLVKTGGAR